MEILQNKNGNTMNVALKGRLDTTTAPQLEEALKSAISDVTSLIFDFSELDYISSAGLRVLLASQKQMNTRGEMKVTHVNDTIMEIFDVTGFTDILTIE
ncbi:MAG: STAS domain-containing protein [Clostridia bacterium]|nr:STAS domain-containing protein [Clostridia bacterium]